ncbi:MAG TPA: SDR family NAD(P)-dependent oxidoreductase [Xanthobacteraceae bacterium]|jgi:NAD(P)-dependent dehydrogenase (short-subunit alcohol dehydrogenase family)|nr:SDR family NAD(P)-dependent oxidoreductase [Xanthobacteraceae bacterium]
MTGEMRFDGQVAIVTGAGGPAPNLGRSFAMLLAALGAKVVVNDLGVGADGRGGLYKASAEAVTDEIRSAGGEAVADTHDVGDPASAKAIVQTAIDRWGRIDILVNNAGSTAPGLFEDISDADVQRVVNAHLMGNIWMCRAVWPHMKRARYGRIVNITSEAVFGFPYLAVYSAAKAGIFGLSRNLALEGAKFNINVNAMGPRATTLKHLLFLEEKALQSDGRPDRKPDQVAPLVAYLAHRDCPISGKFMNALGGHVFETIFLNTRGYVDPAPTIESVRDNFAAAIDSLDASEIPDVDLSKYEKTQFKGVAQL